MQGYPGNEGYRKHYKVTGSLSDFAGIANRRGVDQSDRASGYTNPSKARRNVKLPDGRNAFEN